MVLGRVALGKVVDESLFPSICLPFISKSERLFSFTQARILMAHGLVSKRDQGRKMSIRTRMFADLALNVQEIFRD